MRFVCLLALCVGCAAKPVALEARGKTEAVVGANCTSDAACDLGEFCDLPVCIPERPCPSVGRCVDQTRFYDFAEVAIPDADPRGIERRLEVVKPDLVVASAQVHVQIQHTYRGDLRVVLVSPAGTEIVLHDRGGRSADDLVISRPLPEVRGEAATGPWTLRVSDHARYDTGVLRSWRLELAYEEPEPGPWADLEVDIESPHPYANELSQSFPLSWWTGGASRTKLHFERISLEEGYDFLEVRDTTRGAVLDRFTGRHEDLWVGPYETGNLELRLVTDESVTGWGFRLDRLELFGAGCLDDEDCGPDAACAPITCIRHPCFSTCEPREPTECAEGETRDDGCNECQCSDGRWLCTRRACVADEGEACGGDTVCADGLVCDRGATGGPACDGGLGPVGAGTCVRPGPRICPAVVMPVCACTGQTFTNDCERAGLAPFAHEGACTLDVPIPDADRTGASATVTVLGPAASTAVRVSVAIRHTWRGDLVVTLEGPDGSRHLLSNREGGSADDFAWDGRIDLGSSVVGPWTLHVADLARYDRGAITFFNVLAEQPASSEGRACGTRGALPCGPEETCVFELGSCGASDRGGVCEPRPEDCPADAAPVCGCDGRTYHNACRALQAGVSVASVGVCPDAGAFCGSRGDQRYCAAGEYCHHDLGESCGWADAPGSCRRPPEFCLAVYEPVCGCDGRTYSNACRANAAGVSVQHEGPCE